MENKCKSYEILKYMMESESYKELVKEYKKPKKETLKKFYLENNEVVNLFLFMNIFLYGYGKVEEYNKEMEEYNILDVSLYSYYNKHYYKEIRIVLRYLCKYEIVNKEQQDLIKKILLRSKKLEI